MAAGMERPTAFKHLQAAEATVAAMSLWSCGSRVSPTVSFFFSIFFSTCAFWNSSVQIKWKVEWAMRLWYNATLLPPPILHASHTPNVSFGAEPCLKIYICPLFLLLYLFFMDHWNIICVLLQFYKYRAIAQSSKIKLGIFKKNIREIVGVLRTCRLEQLHPLCQTISLRDHLYQRVVLEECLQVCPILSATKWDAIRYPLLGPFHTSKEGA